MAAVSERDALAKVASAQLAAISADLADAEAEIAARSAEITISAERHAVEVEEGAERGGGACGMAGGGPRERLRRLRGRQSEPSSAQLQSRRLDCRQLVQGPQRRR